MTKARHPVARIYCSQKSGMKEAWFLASNRTDLSAAKALAMYGKRWVVIRSPSPQLVPFKRHRFGKQRRRDGETGQTVTGKTRGIQSTFECDKLIEEPVSEFHQGQRQ